MVSKTTFELFHTYRHINLAKQQLEELLRNTKGYPLIKNIARQQLIKINHIISSLTVYLSLKDLEILNKGMFFGMISGSSSNGMMLS